MSRQTSARITTVIGVVGKTPITVLGALKAGQYLRVHNPNDGAFLAATYDGVTVPVVFGAGITIGPLAADSWDTFVPSGAVQLVSDQVAGANYTLMYLTR